MSLLSYKLLAKCIGLLRCDLAILDLLLCVQFLFIIGLGQNKNLYVASGRAVGTA